MRIKREAMDRLRAMGTDYRAKLSACGKRVEAAGGLAAVDPAGEMERIKRIPAVQDVSKQYRTSRSHGARVRGDGRAARPSRQSMLPRARLPLRMTGLLSFACEDAWNVAPLGG
jgi:hypothetical protein